MPRKNGSRHHEAHSSTTIYSTKEDTKRIILRGSLYYAQKCISKQGTRESDHWQDIGGGYSKKDAARIAGVEL